MNINFSKQNPKNNFSNNPLNALFQSELIADESLEMEKKKGEKDLVKAIQEGEIKKKKKDLEMNKGFEGNTEGYTIKVRDAEGSSVSESDAAFTVFSKSKLSASNNNNVKQSVLDVKKNSAARIQDDVARMYINARIAQNKRSSAQTTVAEGTDRTDPGKLFNFEKELEKLKKRAIEEGEEEKFNYYVDQNKGSQKIQADQTDLINVSGVSKRPEINTITPQKEQRLNRIKQQYHIPNNVEERIKKRYVEAKNPEKNLNRTPKKTTNRSKSQFWYAEGGRMPEFKNNFESGIKVKMGLDMLHTDELMGYYKEVVNKGNRDLVVHQRQQNFIKKMELI